MNLLKEKENRLVDLLNEIKEEADNIAAIAIKKYGIQC